MRRFVVNHDRKGFTWLNAAHETQRQVGDNVGGVTGKGFLDAVLNHLGIVVGTLAWQHTISIHTLGLMRWSGSQMPLPKDTDSVASLLQLMKVGRL
jgi:hypothetical protein